MRKVLAVLMAVVGLLQVQAQAQAEPPPCSDTAYRDFDFWVGEWTVTSPARPGWVAYNSITRANSGCSIHEHYRTPGGYSGNSINFYNAKTKQWHQTWIDNQGSPLHLEGGLVDGNMTLSNDTSRIVWTPMADGRVRQHWQATSDGGKTWKTVFDGIYTRQSIQG